MSPLVVVLIVVVLAAIGAGAYKLLMGGDRRQRRIESARTESLEHYAAPGVTDFDPTHFDAEQGRRR